MDSPKTTQLEDARARLPSQVRLFAALLVAAVVVSQLPLPVRLAGVVFSVWAGVVGMRALGLMSTLGRAGQRQRGQLALSVGLGAVVIISVQLLTQAAFLPAGLEYQRCLAGAGTVEARTACEDAYQRDLDRLTGRLVPGR